MNRFLRELEKQLESLQILEEMAQSKRDNYEALLQDDPDDQEMQDRLSFFEDAVSTLEDAVESLQELVDAYKG